MPRARLLLRALLALALGAAGLLGPGAARCFAGLCVTACGGVRPTSERAQIVAVTGAGTAPAATSRHPAADQTVSGSSDATTEASALGDALGWPAPVIVLPLALVALILAWLSLRRRRRRAGESAGAPPAS